MNRKLRKALEALFQVRGASPYVITSEQAQKTSAAVIVNLFVHWYRALGFSGCSSHSGRRTFITGAAKKNSTVGLDQGRSDPCLSRGVEHYPALH
jgi:integrase/recombinase XerD